MLVHESPVIDLSFRPAEAGANFDTLRACAVEQGSALRVPRGIIEPTFRLLDQLHDFDPETACESIQSLPYALAAAEAIEGFYTGPEVDRHFVFSATLLHDIGKITLDKDLIDTSNAGVVWTEECAEAMEQHAAAGARIVEENGLPVPVQRAVAEHHGKQLSRHNYGVFPVLNYLERTTRDCVAVGDFADAALHRTNSRNRHLSLTERLNEIMLDTALVFNDYERGSDLAGVVFKHLSAQPEPFLLAA